MIVYLFFFFFFLYKYTHDTSQNTLNFIFKRDRNLPSRSTVDGRNSKVMLASYKKNYKCERLMSQMLKRRGSQIKIKLTLI